MKLAIVLVCLLLFFNEFFIYYVTLFKCRWPGQGLKVMVLADTHLLGSRLGHWWDKLRREWQMYRSFQTAIALFQPEVVFFLGDIFDEGKWCSPEEFQYYINRFDSLFKVPKEVRVGVVAGNHDIGFHYATTPYLRHRFERAFNNKGVEILSINGNHFILVNSVAMEGDECNMCKSAEQRIRELGSLFTCVEMKGDCSPSLEGIKEYSRPILLQHYPLFRESDEICEGPDAATGKDKVTKFREKWDCLSREASDLLLEQLKPRAIFSGHTHHGCNLTHNGIPEWSVASFSWRNRNNPNFLLLSVTPDDLKIEKCFLPYESTVVGSYMYGFMLIFVISFISLARHVRRRANDMKRTHEH